MKNISFFICLKTQLEFALLHFKNRINDFFNFKIYFILLKLMLIYKIFNKTNAFF
jgi:hypothetical protein